MSISLRLVWGYNYEILKCQGFKNKIITNLERTGWSKGNDRDKDARILSEYQDVLHPPKFNFNKDQIAILLDFIKQYGLFISSSPLKNRLPDPDDEPFFEVAIAGGVCSIVTGNIVHYPLALCEGLRIFSPSEFIEYYRKQKKLQNQPLNSDG